ncbi:hypothetical protein KGA66_10995 [Actinocrinis puniceicyclus]|uniref:Swt1-like HEPN domain-containing protein n=1 Tax=Actinocrinis puniceicyclus TaxID=977794 RepID=A0A8J8BCY7_9ACTN|nr:hypothetical protein [Actinocrinis puniceicyclus]MBS2963576.1 hypothetical protein [Actinocrinis puniceicyclus]
MLAWLAGGAGGRTETRPIVIEAWREKTPSATVSFLRQLVATAKEAGLPPLRRPRALIVAAAEDLPADLPDQLARDEIAVHWWWGAVGRLDTATVVAVNRPPTTGMVGRQQLLEAVVQATVTELSGPFLEVAAELAGWDGNPETLLEALRRAVSKTAEGDAVLPDRGDCPAGGNRPAQLALLAWSGGLIDSWDGRVRWHPAYDLADPRTISTRVWLAQHHALLPRLDEVREDFTDVVRRRARIPLARLDEKYGPRSFGAPTDPATGSGTGRTLTAMELGSMWGANLNGHIALNEVERRRLRVLWQSRNRLAHRIPLDAAQLHQLITELNA